MNYIKAVLFDLDGALIDTVPGLTKTINTLLQKYNKPSLASDIIRRSALKGGASLITQGFNISHEHPDFSSIKNEFLTIYRENITATTKISPEIVTLLNQLEAQNIKWGVVTNKPGWLTMPLLDTLNLSDKAFAIINGDTLHVKKSHPGPILHARLQASCELSECVYVSASEWHILAGIRAETKTAVASFGYISEADTPESWGADKMLNEPLELLNWIDEINQTSGLSSLKIAG